MANSFVAAEAAFTVSGTSVTITKPAGTIDGDVMVAHITSDGAPTIAAPAGWTVIQGGAFFTAVAARAFYKVASSEGANYAFTTDVAEGITGIIATFRGVDTTTPMDQTPPAATEAGDSATVTSPSIITQTDGAWVLSLIGTDAINTVVAEPTDMTNVLGAGGEINTGLASGSMSAMAYVEQAVAGASGAKAWTTGAAEQSVAMSAALRPAAAAPQAPPNPAAVAVSSSQIDVTWDDVTDETGYRVERSPDGVGSWVDVSGNLAADTVSYSDTGLTASTQYFYRVFAFNAAGDSLASAVVNATTQAAAAGGNRMGGTGAIRKPPRPTQR